MNKLLKIFITIIILSSLYSCKDETDESCNIVFPDTGKVSYLHHVQPLFDCSCTFIGCHDDGTREALGFSLTDYDNFMTGASRQIVNRGDPDGSPLIQRVEGRLGLRMPPDRPPLNTNQTNGLRRWVKDGAPLN